MRRNYKDESEKLAKAIDIAVEAFEKHPRKDITVEWMAHTISVYKDWKEAALSPKPQFKNLASLQYIIEDVLGYFNEAAGEDVEFFWTKVTEANLGYKRENKMLKILKRKRIKDVHEYDFVIAAIVPYSQLGLTTKEEDILLKRLIGDFESKEKP